MHFNGHMHRKKGTHASAAHIFCVHRCRFKVPVFVTQCSWMNMHKKCNHSGRKPLPISRCKCSYIMSPHQKNSLGHISWNLSTNSSSPKGLTQQVRGKSCSDLAATQAWKLELLSYRAINKKPLWTSSMAVLREGNMSTLSDLWQSELTLKSGQSKWVMS